MLESLPFAIVKQVRNERILVFSEVREVPTCCGVHGWRHSSIVESCWVLFKDRLFSDYRPMRIWLFLEVR